MSTYSSKLRDPRWQKKRLEIFAEANWRCECCDTKDDELHAHHMIYRKGVEPWQYGHGEIITLCATCHKEYTDLRQKIDESILNYVSEFPSFQYAFYRILGFMHSASEMPELENRSYNAGYLAGRVAELSQFNDAGISSKVAHHSHTKEAV
jgi:hypothetical protein